MQAEREFDTPQGSGKMPRRLRGRNPDSIAPVTVAPGLGPRASVFDYRMTRVRLTAWLLAGLGSSVADEMSAVLSNFPG